MGGRFFNSNSFFLENDADFNSSEYYANSLDNYMQELISNDEQTGQQDPLLQSLLS